MRRAAAGLVLALVALLAVLPAAPAAAEPGPVVVQGKVTNGTPGGAAPGGTAVTIVQLDKDLGEHARSTVQAGPDGSYRSEGWDGRAGNRFVASADHLDVSYRGTATGDSGTLRCDVTIFETTTDDTAIRFASDTIAVVPSDRGVMETLQILRVVNGSDRTYVGDMSAKPPTVLELPVPSGAYDLTPQDGLQGGLSANGGRVSTADPVPPGTSVVSFLYRVRVPGGRWDLRHPVSYPTDKVNVLLGPGLTWDAAGFTYRGTVPLDNRTYGRWDGPALEPGTELAGSVGSDAAGPGLSWGLAAGLGTLLAAVVAVPLLLRRRRRASPVADVSERTRLVEEIAALDDALEAGSVSRQEHAERRGVLKRRLVDLTGPP